jgi:hypothetical protein
VKRRAARAKCGYTGEALSENPAIRYRRHPQTAGRIIDGLAFVVTADDNKLHTLNAAATRLWQLAAEGCTVDDAADELTARFEVERAVAHRDAAACLADMAARRILVAG